MLHFPAKYEVIYHKYYQKDVLICIPNIIERFSGRPEVYVVRTIRDPSTKQVPDYLDPEPTRSARSRTSNHLDPEHPTI